MARYLATLFIRAEPWRFDVTVWRIALGILDELFTKQESAEARPSTRTPRLMQDGRTNPIARLTPADIVRVTSQEWLSIRDEAVKAMDRRLLIMTWGSTVLSALVSGAVWLLIEHGNMKLSYWALTLIVPPFTFVWAALWAGEAMRAGRAGHYNAILESELTEWLKRIDDRGGAASLFLDVSRESGKRPVAPLGWESYLRAKRTEVTGFWKSLQLELPYFAAGVFFGGTAVGSLAGAEVIARTCWHGHIGIWPIIVAVVTLGYYGWLLLWTRRIP